MRSSAASRGEHAVWRNAILAVGQVVFTGGVMLLVYRFLLARIGAIEVGIWATVLATSSAARISELGFSASATKFVAAAGESSEAAAIVQTTVLTVGLFLAALSGIAYLPFARILTHNIPTENVAQALAILPYALISVWINGIGGVIQSALDGCQRADVRAVITMVTSVVYLVLVWALTPSFGLIGLGVAQILQGALLITAGWIALRRELMELPLIPHRWTGSYFRRMFRYGVSFQLISISAILVDPIAKLAVTRFGGLTAAAFFDIAQRVVLQVRTLIVAANQVLVPRIAALHGSGDSRRTNDLYAQSYRAVFFVAVPVSGLLFASLPLLSLVSIGRIDGDFMLFGAMLVCGYFVNAISAPAYFYGLGLGTLRWNVISHISLSVLTFALSYSLGAFFGAAGAVAGVAGAVAIASLVTIVGTNVQHGFPLSEVLPFDSKVLLVASFVAGALGLWLSRNLSANGSGGLVSLVLATLIVGAAVWRHPLRPTLWVKVTGVKL